MKCITFQQNLAQKSFSKDTLILDWSSIVCFDIEWHRNTVVTNTNDKNAMIVICVMHGSLVVVSLLFCLLLLSICHGTRQRLKQFLLARLVLDGVAVAGVVVLICHNFYNCLHTTENVPFDYTRGKTVRNRGSFHVEHIITGYTLSRTHKFRLIDTIFSKFTLNHTWIKWIENNFM